DLLPVAFANLLDDEGVKHSGSPAFALLSPHTTPTLILSPIFARWLENCRATLSPTCGGFKCRQDEYALRDGSNRWHHPHFNHFAERYRHLRPRRAPHRHRRDPGTRAYHGGFVDETSVSGSARERPYAERAGTTAGRFVVFGGVAARDPRARRR